MLKRKFRLPKDEFSKLEGKIENPFFRMRYSKNSLSYPRLSLVVSKRVEGRASTRNRLKRLFRTSLEELLPEFLGYDVLFNLKRESLDKSKKFFSEKLRAELKKAKIIE